MVCAVEDGLGDGDAMVGRLDNGVLFGMETAAQLMTFPGGNGLKFAEAADVEAVPQPGRSTVVTRGQDLFVLDEDGPHMPPEAGGPFGHEMGDVHEIFVPGRTVRMRVLLLFLFQGKAMPGQRLEISDFGL
jgi:hypothetical protein